MSRLAVLGLLLALAVTALLAQALPRASATPVAARVVDRTLTCRVGFSNGARLIIASASSAVGNGATLDSLAFATIATPGQPLPTKKNYNPTLAGVTAGWPPPPPVKSGGLGYENTRCGATTRKVPWSRRGLTGGTASPWGDELRCISPRTVLVRVRATFSEPVTAEPSARGDFVTAAGRVLVGQVAARTLAGRQLVYADVADSGRARLFTARTCS